MMSKRLSPSVSAVADPTSDYFSRVPSSEPDIGRYKGKKMHESAGIQAQYDIRSNNRDRGTMPNRWLPSDPPSADEARPRPRSATVRRANTIDNIGSFASISAPEDPREAVRREKSDEIGSDSLPEDDDAEETEREHGKGKGAAKDRPQRLRSSSLGSAFTRLSSSTAKTSGSGSSSGSGSTMTRTASTGPESGSGEDTGDRDNRSSEGRGKAPEILPDVLSFLDPDSPAVTEESIQRSVAEAATWRSPSVRSSSSSASSRSDGSFSTADTDLTTSTERSVDGDDFGASPTPIATTTFTVTRLPDPPKKSPIAESKVASQTQAAQKRQQRAQSQAHRYGTPEMPRGPAVHPHLPPNALQPRVPNQGHAKHLPRAEKLPLSGYELLASRLSSRPSRRPPSRPGSNTSSPGSSPTESNRVRRGSVTSAASAAGHEPTLKPIYRRFEGLNHRLLLHLQDELSELEEQLHRLDTADTQTRRLQNCILPASRRAEYLAGGELQWHRTDILGKIGFKLGQYNHVLSSFTSTHSLPSPSLVDIEAYRTYLAATSPIAEIETRFLDPTEDLVTLAASPSAPSTPQEERPASEYFPSSPSDDALTPMPLPRKLSHSPSSAPTDREHTFLPGLPSPAPSPGPDSSASFASELNAATKTPLASTTITTSSGETASMPMPLLRLALALAAAVLVPVLAFAVIPGFGGRMTVVLLAGMAVAAVYVQAAAAAAAVTGGGPGEGWRWPGYSARDLLLCAGVYGGVMAIVAAVVR